MLPIYKKIKERRIELKLSQQKLADLTGYSDRSSIAKIEKGLVDLSESKINILAKALNTTPAYLMGWTESDNYLKNSIINKITEVSEKLSEKRQTKVLSYAKNELKEQNTVKEDFVNYSVQAVSGAAAGVGYSYDNNDIQTYYTDEVPPKHDYATVVCGDSMEPRFYNGDIVLIRAGYDNINGEIYVIDYDGKSYIKKLYNEGTHFRLKSINKKYEDIIIYISDIKDTYFNIVGKVITSIQPIDV